MQKLLTTLVIFLTVTLSLHATPLTQSADEIKITDIHGKRLTIVGTDKGLDIKGLEGKIVFLEFFGHRCPPCLRSIPHLIKLQKKYQDRLAIIAVEVQGLTNDRLKQFATQKGMNYTVVSQEKAGILVDYIAQRAEWSGGIPFLIALDGGGDVQFVQAGMVPESALEGLIKELTPTPEQNSTTPESNTTKK